MGIFMQNVLRAEVQETLKNDFLIRERNYGSENLKFQLPIANNKLFTHNIVYQRQKL